jgi:hypothetical protein
LHSNRLAKNPLFITRSHLPSPLSISLSCGPYNLILHPCFFYSHGGQSNFLLPPIVAAEGCRVATPSSSRRRPVLLAHPVSAQVARARHPVLLAPPPRASRFATALCCSLRCPAQLTPLTSVGPDLVLSHPTHLAPPPCATSSTTYDNPIRDNSVLSPKPLHLVIKR